MQPPPFTVIPSAQVREVLQGQEKQVTEVVEAAYRRHGEGRTVNPDSYFLRFPDRPSSRIIALPASLGDVHGLKWISSFPENVAGGIPRASAVLILNDVETGFPFACMEASVISAARTAASAALATVELSTRRGVRPSRAGFVGTGLIARYVHTYLAANGFTFDEVGVHDLSAEHAAGFRGYLERTVSSMTSTPSTPVRRSETATTFIGPHSSMTETAITVHDKAEDLIRASDLIVFATVAGEPHVHDPAWFGHNPLVLHVSLRDLSTDVILASCNVADDVEHCMKANTSLHLTEQRTGGRDFVAGDMRALLAGEIDVPADRPVVFSPFGLGVLDLAVGAHVHEQVTRDGGGQVVPGFFDELKRYG